MKKRNVKKTDKKQTVVDRALNEILNGIISGRFKPGKRLPSEFEFMNELGIGRNSLREAMKILATMGIVEIKQGDGTYICSQVDPCIFDAIIYNVIFDLSSCEELIEARFILDAGVLKLVVEKANQRQIELLEQNYEELCYNIKAGNLGKVAELDLAFHLMLADMCGNIFLSRISKGIYQLYGQTIKNNIETNPAFIRADIYHNEIIECIKNRKVEDVERVINYSLTVWRNFLKK